MKSLLLQTKREKAGTVDGLNLFFGALLGANLGTLGRLPIGYYVEITILLAVAVVGLRVLSTSERRLYALVSLLAIAAVLWLRLGSDDFREGGLAAGDLQRLQATLAVWISFVIMIEIVPTYDPPAGTDADGDRPHATDRQRTGTGAGAADQA
jgi:hypothetical protein